MKLLLAGLAFILALASPALAEEGCPQGTYSVVNAPDGTSLSVLFDAFVLVADGSPAGARQRKDCQLRIPLHLPEGTSLGVYRVDYRGFAHLGPKQTAELTVDYQLGPRNKGRSFRRKVKGQSDGEFLFTENIGAGLMKRVGCGESAVLNVSLSLALNNAVGGEAMAALDSADGAAKGGLVYYFDTKPCRR